VSARATLGGVLASAAILVLGWHLGSSASTSTTTATSPSVPLEPVTPGAPAASAPSAPSSAQPATNASGSFTGQAVGTPFGTMQVKVVVAGGRITDVVVLQATDQGGRSRQISAAADPVLRDEVLKAQSAKVQMVSGATYTSQGYLRSLQSALDQAGL